MPESRKEFRVVQKVLDPGLRRGDEKHATIFILKQEQLLGGVR